MANMKMVALHAILTVAAVAIIAAWSSDMAAQDAGLFKTKCAACHGADGKGDSPMGKKMGLRGFASPEVQKMSDDELTAIIADGKEKMPSYKKSLKPEQIAQLVSYIRSLGKK